MLCKGGHVRLLDRVREAMWLRRYSPRTVRRQWRGFGGFRSRARCVIRVNSGARRSPPDHLIWPRRTARGSSSRAYHVHGIDQQSVREHVARRAQQRGTSVGRGSPAGPALQRGFSVDALCRAELVGRPGENERAPCSAWRRQAARVACTPHRPPPAGVERTWAKPSRTIRRSARTARSPSRPPARCRSRHNRRRRSSRRPAASARRTRRGPSC